MAVASILSNTFGKIDAQNYIIVYTDSHKNGNLVTKGPFLHNKKLSASKKNEEQVLENKNVVIILMLSDVPYL